MPTADWALARVDRGDVAGFAGAFAQQRLQLAAVLHQLVVAGLDGCEQLDDGFAGGGLQRCRTGCSQRRALRDVSPVQAARISSRLLMPGFSARSKRTSLSLSVTARLNFFRMAAGSSSR